MSVPISGQLLEATGAQSSRSVGTPRTVTTSGAILSTDYFILLGASSITVTLPLASSLPGKQFIIKNDNTHSGTTIAPTSPDTIYGGTNIGANNDVKIVMSDGISGWHVIGLIAA